MAPRKKPVEDHAKKEATITLPFIGEVSWKVAIILFLFFSTDPGERLLKNLGASTQIADIETIKSDVQEIKRQVAKITVEVGEIKSLADVKKKALDSVASK